MYELNAIKLGFKDYEIYCMKEFMKQTILIQLKFLLGDEKSVN